MPGVAADFDPGLNRGLGINGGIVHFAFKAENEADLAEKKSRLQTKNVDVSEIVDHGWCKSIYFKDPNSLQLEYCVVTAEFTNAHVADRHSSEWTRLAR